MNFTCLRLLCVISFYETWFVLHYKYEYYSTVILYTDVYFMYSYTHNAMMESKIVQVINAVNLYFLKAQNGRFDFKNKLESTSM